MNYGDQTRLNSTKLASGTSGPIVQRTPTGRPAAGPMVPVTPVVTQAPQAEVPQEHQALMDRYARALRADKKIQAKASAADAGPLLKFYATLSRRWVKQVATDLDQRTPRFL
jgi:hypothetical protein